MTSHPGRQQKASQPAKAATVVTVDNIPTSGKDEIINKLRENVTAEDTTENFVKMFGPRVVAKVYDQEFKKIYGNRPPAYLEDIEAKTKEHARKIAAEIRAAHHSSFNDDNSLWNQIFVPPQPACIPGADTSPQLDDDPPRHLFAPANMTNTGSPHLNPATALHVSNIGSAQSNPFAIPPVPNFGNIHRLNTTTALTVSNIDSAHSNPYTPPPVPKFGGPRLNPFTGGVGNKRKADDESSNPKSKSPRKA